MGDGVHPTKCMAHLEKDDNLLETIWTIKVAYAKSLKVAWDAPNWTLDSNNCN
jgi:hypothetical protein